MSGPTSDPLTLTQTQWEHFTQNMNDFFLIVIAMIVFFMQAGFAFLELGAVRSKNSTNILMKNILDSAIGSVIYWICGYAFAFGAESNSVIGYKNFCLVDLDPKLNSHYFFHFVFAATAATIVSGAMAERTKFIAYFIYSFAITGFVYPVVSHWAWDSKGWLAAECWWDEISYRDFAGSGVVHMVGGAAGLMGTLALGPRLDQYVDGKRQRVKGHTVPMMSLGAFILFFGFFAFNGGSQASITQEGDGSAVAHILKNTILSGSCGGLTVVLVYFIVNRKFTLLGCINGMLTGMVAICAGCDVIDGWGATATGFIGGLVFVAYSELLFKLGVDDPLDAFAVHYGGGSWGLFAVCLLAKDEGILYKFDEASFKLLAWNTIGGLAITAWTVILTGPLFFAPKFAGLLRVSENTEKQGLDLKEHGESAYPADAYLSDELFKALRFHGNSAITGNFVTNGKPQRPSQQIELGSLRNGVVPGHTNHAAELSDEVGQQQQNSPSNGAVETGEVIARFRYNNDEGFL